MCFYAAFAALLIAATAQAQTPARSDTTIKGQRYAQIDAADFLTALRTARAGTQLEYRATAVRGPVFAPTSGLDTVRAALLLNDVIFLGEIALSNVVFAAEFRGENVEFRGGLSALKTRFDADCTLQQSTSRRHTNFKQAVFAAESNFSGSAFEQTASFIETRFSRATFSHVRFAGEAYFERADFAAEADFKDAFFEGNAQFKNARFNDDAHFGGARFIQRTRFWQTVFAKRSTFDNARSRGEISFRQAVFWGPAHFRHITFVHPVGFAGATFHHPTTFAGSHFKKAVDFSGVRFHADLDLNADFKSTLDLRYSRGPILDLLPAIDDRDAQNPDSTLTDTARLYLQHANFARASFRWPQLSGRLATEDSTGADLGPVYAKLHHYLLAEGLTEDARACFAAAMEHKRRALGPTDAAWYGLHLWRLTTYYGADLSRLALFIAVCVLSFSLLYRLAPGHHNGALDCLYYSTLVFFRLKVPSDAQLFTRWLSIAQALIGWLCLGLFIAALVGYR